MLGKGLSIAWSILKIFLWILIPVYVFIAVFGLLCFCWVLYFRKKHGMVLPRSGVVKLPKRGLFKQLFCDLPRRYALDMLERDPDQFGIHGIHVFCGEQGAGKTIGAVEMILRLQKQYPKSKTITNFGLTTENDELKKWQQLLTYTNGKKGVIVGIDEIQNWFMSGNNKLPPEMLEVATQNRKNCRVLCCTAQVFTRVNKGLREQFTMIYQPHTFCNCFTVVIKRKPVFDSEGNVIDLKYRGMYSFVHSDELRAAYDTYKVIHTLAKEGFKDQPVQPVTNVYVAADGKRR